MPPLLIIFYSLPLIFFTIHSSIIFFTCSHVFRRDATLCTRSKNDTSVAFIFKLHAQWSLWSNRKIPTECIIIKCREIIKALHRWLRSVMGVILFRWGDRWTGNEFEQQQQQQCRSVWLEPLSTTNYITVRHQLGPHRQSRSANQPIPTPTRDNYRFFRIHNQFRRDERTAFWLGLFYQPCTAPGTEVLKQWSGVDSLISPSASVDSRPR